MYTIIKVENREAETIVIRGSRPHHWSLLAVCQQHSIYPLKVAWCLLQQQHHHHRIILHSPFSTFLVLFSSTRGGFQESTGQGTYYERAFDCILLRHIVIQMIVKSLLQSRKQETAEGEYQQSSRYSQIQRFKTNLFFSKHRGGQT